MPCSSLPSFVQSFISESLGSAMKICGQHLIAVYIFGGAAKGYFSKDVSDVDLLFIVSDDCSDEDVSMLENRLVRLEAKYGILQTDKVDLLYYAFQVSLFKSHYILRLKNLQEMDSSSMFSAGNGFKLLKYNIKLFDSIVTSRLMMRNILKESRILCGQDVLKQMTTQPTTSTAVVSIFLVSWILSMFGFISSMFSRSGTRFSLEALKWYLHNIYSTLNDETTTIKQSINYALSKHLLPRSFFIKFLEIRNTYSPNLAFCAVTPLCLMIAHARVNRHLRHVKS